MLSRILYPYIFSMKRFLSIGILTLALAACTDTTGLSPETSRTAHPQTSASAAVVLAEYADLQCPACRAAHETVVPPLLAKYGTQISYEFHHFPLSSIHRYALEAAEAAECAADQGKFWEFADLVFKNQQELSPESLDKWGAELKLDMDLFNRCRDSRIKREMIQSEYDQGRNLGVRGTPTFFVNGEQVEATVDGLSAAIDAALGSAASRL